MESRTPGGDPAPLSFTTSASQPLLKVMDSRWARETFVSIRIPFWPAPHRHGDPTSSKRFSRKRPLSLAVISCLLLLLNPVFSLKTQQICSTFLPLECARAVHVADSSACIYAVKTGLLSKHRQMMSLQQRRLHLRDCNTWTFRTGTPGPSCPIVSSFPPRRTACQPFGATDPLPPPRPDGIT